MPNVASEMLKAAAEAVSGDRERTHGSALQNHQNIARMWSAYLVNAGGQEIGPVDVANMMELLKVARRQSGAHNMDDYVDGAGYAAMALEVREMSEDETLRQRMKRAEHAPNQGTDSFKAAYVGDRDAQIEQDFEERMSGGLAQGTAETQYEFTRTDQVLDSGMEKEDPRAYEDQMDTAEAIRDRAKAITEDLLDEPDELEDDETELPSPDEMAKKLAPEKPEDT